MIRSILFDLDGTLLDTLDDLANSVNYALRTHHLPERSHTEIRSFLGNGIRNLMLDAVGRGMSDEAFEPVFQTFRTYYVEHCLDKSKPFAGIIDLLKALQQRGITMAVVSNKLHPAVVELNERFFKDYITSAVGESATVRRKPNPTPYLPPSANWDAAKTRPYMWATPKSTCTQPKMPACSVCWCCGVFATKTFCVACLVLPSLPNVRQTFFHGSIHNADEQIMA